MPTTNAPGTPTTSVAQELVDLCRADFEYETTFKPTGLRSTMKEMAKYTVADGKIVKEEFFYAPKA